MLLAESAAAEQLLAQVAELDIVTCEQEEKIKIYVIGSLVVVHLESGESHSEQIGCGI